VAPLSSQRGGAFPAAVRGGSSVAETVLPVATTRISAAPRTRTRIRSTTDFMAPASEPGQFLPPLHPFSGSIGSPIVHARWNNHSAEVEETLENQLRRESRGIRSR